MTPFALFFMLLSMAAVTLLTGYCFYRILSGGARLADPEEDAREAARAGSVAPEARRTEP